MSKRASLLMNIAGVIAIVGGLYVAWSSWVAAAEANGASGFLDFIDPARGIAFADSLTGTVSDGLALPRLVLTEPLLWLGVALILGPRIYHHFVRPSTKHDPAYAGYAFVQCPECRAIVSVSAKHCPLCGTQLFSPWTNGSRSGLGASRQRA